MSADTIKVLVVEDQMLVRQGIVGLLDLIDDVAIVGQAADGLEAIGAIERLRPDVVLLDIRMPRLDGIAVLEALRTGESLARVLVLTTFDDPDLARACFEAGACGYMLKDCSLAALAAAIRAIASGSTALSHKFAERLRARAADCIDPLTPREQDILRLLGEGLSNREISRSLGLAEGTVKNHVSNILSKLNVPDRTRAALKFRSTASAAFQESIGRLSPEDHSGFAIASGSGR